MSTSRKQFNTADAASICQTLAEAERERTATSNVVRVEIPMTLPSVANLREFWAVKARRVKAQRAAVALALKPLHGLSRLPRPLVVTLTRVAPRQLDSDNLVSAFKGCRDSVAEMLDTDDADPRVRWEYAQLKGKPARVVIEFRLEAM